MKTIKTYQDEYENLLKLGEGGFAKVHKVRSKTFGYICAVRRLKNDEGQIKDETDKKYLNFVKECRDLLLIGSGGHSNIVKISRPQLLYHTDEKENQACVEMEYIKGLDIGKLMKQKNNFIDSREVVNFVKDISSALAYCHYDIYKVLVNVDKEYEYRFDKNLKGQKFRVANDAYDNVIATPEQEKEFVNRYKVLHNDIYENNVIRKHTGSYILLDFGLAIQGNEVVRSSKKQAGVPQYWAPERFENKLSEQSDIYAFGCLAYYMLAGRLPYLYSEEDKQHSFEFEEMQLQRKHTDPKHLVPAIEPLRCAAFEKANPGKTYKKDYPDWLENVIMKCLEKDPKNRYANGKELYKEVKIRTEQKESTSGTDSDEIRTLRIQNNALFVNLNKLIDDYKQLKTQKQTGYDSEEVDKLKAKNKALLNELNKLVDEIKQLKAQKERIVEKIVKVPVEKVVEKTVHKNKPTLQERFIKSIKNIKF